MSNSPDPKTDEQTPEAVAGFCLRLLTYPVA